MFPATVRCWIHFFAHGGSKEKLLSGFGFQYVFLENGANLTLNGSPQSNVAVAPPWYNPGNDPGGAVFHAVDTGISILSASGDTATVEMSGWGLSWFGVNISLGDGAWSEGYSNGVGNIICATGSSCVVSSAYTLKYTTTVPHLDPNGWADRPFYLELHGTVGAVPEASTYGMMLAGLGAIGLMVRRRKET